jgi:hypothetical protein
MSAADCRCTSHKGVQADGFRPRLMPRHYKKRFLTPLLSECLTPALLAKAFRGQLVLQDPNDELASVLLERLRATRAAAGEKPPRKVMTERKTITTTLTTG